jgi:hypothetical protein
MQTRKRLATRRDFIRTFYGRSLSRRFGFANLITPDGYSPKTDKGHARNVATAILYLAPQKASGVANTCTDASPVTYRYYLPSFVTARAA